MVKIFIGENNIARLECPKCGKEKKIDVSKYKKIKKAFKLKCSCPCGHAYPVLLERRIFERREVSFIGNFEVVGKKIKGLMTVVNISRSGLKIELNTEHDIVSGDKIRIIFQLDDSNKSRIDRTVTAREIKGRYLGVAFETTDHRDKLGTYISFMLGIGDKNK